MTKEDFAVQWMKVKMWWNGLETWHKVAIVAAVAVVLFAI